MEHWSFGPEGTYVKDVFNLQTGRLIPMKDTQFPMVFSLMESKPIYFRGHREKLNLTDRLDTTRFSYLGSIKYWKGWQNDALFNILCTSSCNLPSKMLSTCSSKFSFEPSKAKRQPMKPLIENDLWPLTLMTFSGLLHVKLITVSEVGLELPSSLKSGFVWALHLQSTV